MVPSHPYVLLRCDACDQLIDPETASSGLLIFPRAGETTYEEPPLCSRCGMAIGLTAMVRWAEEEEEG
jgi:hypothetical protein